MIYACIAVDIKVIYTYIIYLGIVAILLIFDTEYTKKKLETNYTVTILMLILYMYIFVGSILTYYTVIFTLILICIKEIINKVKKEKAILENDIKIPIGFYLCVSNIILIILSNFLYNWVM